MQILLFYLIKITLYTYDKFYETFINIIRKKTSIAIL